VRPMSRYIGVLAVAALAMSTLATTGCTGTRAAYDAADTLDERAYVATEHYAAVVKQAADLKDLGVLKGSALNQARELESVAQPLVLSLAGLVANYNAARTAETEVALQRALDEAIVAIAGLVRIVKAAGGGAT
jgi:hypothetical protein